MFLDGSYDNIYTILHDSLSTPLINFSRIRDPSSRTRYIDRAANYLRTDGVAGTESHDLPFWGKRFSKYR